MLWGNFWGKLEFYLVIIVVLRIEVNNIGERLRFRKKNMNLVLDVDFIGFVS